MSRIRPGFVPLPFALQRYGGLFVLPNIFCERKLNDNRNIVNVLYTVIYEIYIVSWYYFYINAHNGD